MKIRKFILLLLLILSMLFPSEKLANNVVDQSYFHHPLSNSEYKVTSPFGFRPHPIHPSNPNFHYGIDFAASLGTNVESAENGFVYQADELRSYGKTVVIIHKDGFATRYAHLDEIFVRPGDVVSRGEVIGTVGITGAATGPHLHFELLREPSSLNFQRVDPENWIN